MLGFFVVGQLAARHGIKVQLRRFQHAGVTALVLPIGRMVQPDPWPPPTGVQARPSKAPADREVPDRQAFRRAFTQATGLGPRQYRQKYGPQRRDT